jgi:hypothetical protein
MADIPLPQLHVGDPRNQLGKGARRRLSDAHAACDLIRTRALAKIEARYRATGDGSDSASAQAEIEIGEANLEAARIVLAAVVREFRAVVKSDKDLRQIVSRELDDAVASFGFSTIQRDLLWRELALFASGSAAPNNPPAPERGMSNGPKAENAQVPEQTAEEYADCSDRHALINNFIQKVSAAGRKPITRKDIFTVAGYKERTEFLRFQRNDRKATKSATVNFTRVLSMTPEKFIEDLKEKKKKTAK